MNTFLSSLLRKVTAVAISMTLVAVTSLQGISGVQAQVATFQIDLTNTASASATQSNFSTAGLTWDVLPFGGLNPLFSNVSQFQLADGVYELDYRYSGFQFAGTGYAIDAANSTNVVAGSTNNRVAFTVAGSAMTLDTVFTSNNFNLNYVFTATPAALTAGFSTNTLTYSLEDVNGVYSANINPAQFIAIDSNPANTKDVVFAMGGNTLESQGFRVRPSTLSLQDSLNAPLTVTAHPTNLDAVVISPTVDTLTLTVEFDVTVPTVDFAFSSSSDDESASPVQVELILNKTFSDPVTVNVSTSDWDATAPGDYTALLNFPVTFLPNETSKMVDLTIIDDQIAENFEWFYLTLTNPTNATIGQTNFGFHWRGISDNDFAGINVQPAASPLTTTEAGGTNTISIFLSTLPTANVVIPILSSDTTEGTVSPTSLTFTPTNGTTAQIVTVTGVDDFLSDGDVNYSVIVQPSASTDLFYNGSGPTTINAMNSDNDVPGIIVTPTTLFTDETGSSGQFSLVLNTVPAANVTINLSSSNTQEGTINPTSVTFTPGNALVPKLVTVTGVDDFTIDGTVGYTIVTDPAASTDGNYNGINAANVDVTSFDNDFAGISVTPVNGLTTNENGGTAQFSINLDSDPSANVVIGLTSSNPSEGTITQTLLTFTPANARIAQVVTVTGIDDVVIDGGVAYSIITSTASSADPNYNFDPADVNLLNLDNDGPGVIVNPTAGLITTEAGGTATFSVALSTFPGADVTIAISSNDNTEGSVNPALLTFTTGNGTTPQVVTITGLDDQLDDGNILYTIITGAAVSTDLNYNGFQPLDVVVSNTDDDTAGVTVSPTLGLTTTELGGTASFAVVLNSIPSADVTLALSSNDATEGTVPALLTFTPANALVTQNVIITGVDDQIIDGDIPYTIITAASVSADAQYNAINPDNVSVTNTDNDFVGITVTPIAGLTTTEAGATAQFTVVLNSLPSANVTINLSSSLITEGSANPTSLTFTALDGMIPQTVTVTGTDDLVIDGDQNYSIITADAQSPDVNYANFVVDDVSLTNTDNDVANVIVTPVAGLSTTEGGGTAQFTVALATIPTAIVTIGLSSSNTSEGTISSALLTFQPDATAVLAQAVTISGVNDAILDGNVPYTITTAAAVSADGNYSNFNASDVDVVNNDNDTGGITVTPTVGLTTTEIGGQASFTVVLNTLPTADVTINLTSDNLGEGTVSPASLTFTSLNGTTPQTVTVTGVDDFSVDANVVYNIITGAAVSTDATYGGVDPSDVQLSNTDNDVTNVIITPVAGLTTTEAGGAATFTVVLTSFPVAITTINLTSSDVTEGTVLPASLDFDGGNALTPQTVTITGVDDAIADGNIAYTIITAAIVTADPTYNGFNPSDVAVTNNDNEGPGIIVTPVAGLTTTEAGGTATFTVVLNTNPTANVTIPLSSSDTTEGTVLPASLTFTSLNGTTAQTVTVTGVNDALIDGDVGYTIVTGAAVSTDGNYVGNNPPDVAVTNTDNDPGILLTAGTNLVTNEFGRQETFTVVLTTVPTANVVIGLTSSNPAEGTVAPAPLTFTPANAKVPQIVTITGVDDGIADGNIPYTIVTAAALSTDLTYNALNPVDVSLTNLDNETAFISVLPATGLVTTEAGGTTSFVVVLNTVPTANVNVVLVSNVLTEGTVAPGNVVFTPANALTPQVVTVTGVDDAIFDGPKAYTIITNPATSTDLAYNTLNAVDVSVTNNDNDVAPPAGGGGGGGGGGAFISSGATLNFAVNNQNTTQLTAEAGKGIIIDILSTDSSGSTPIVIGLKEDPTLGLAKLAVDASTNKKATAKLNWTPSLTTLGVYKFVFTAKSSNGTTTKAFTITVKAKGTIITNEVGDCSFSDGVSAAVISLCKLGIIDQPTSAGNYFDQSKSSQFFGGNPINRAEFTKLMISITHQESEIERVARLIQDSNLFTFPDVEPIAWFAKYITIAKTERTVDGYSSGMFIPWNNIELSEAFKILINAAANTNGKIKADLDEAEKILGPDAPWFAKYDFLVNSYGGFKTPKDIDPGLSLSRQMTRNEAINIIYTVIQNAGIEPQSKLSELKEQLANS